jgi:hypothetical protein
MILPADFLQLSRGRRLDDAALDGLAPLNRLPSVDQEFAKIVRRDEPVCGSRSKQRPRRARAKTC